MAPLPEKEARRASAGARLGEEGEANLEEKAKTLDRPRRNSRSSVTAVGGELTLLLLETDLATMSDDDVPWVREPSHSSPVPISSGTWRIGQDEDDSSSSEDASHVSRLHRLISKSPQFCSGSLASKMTSTGGVQQVDESTVPRRLFTSSALDLTETITLDEKNESKVCATSHVGSRAHFMTPELVVNIYNEVGTILILDRVKCTK